MATSKIESASSQTSRTKSILTATLSQNNIKHMAMENMKRAIVDKVTTKDSANLSFQFSSPYIRHLLTTLAKHFKKC
eukprot:6487685-Amphidinium_carterae.2